jgi:hypothetical protein
LQPLVPQVDGASTGQLGPAPEPVAAQVPLPLMLQAAQVPQPLLVQQTPSVQKRPVWH